MTITAALLLISLAGTAAENESCLQRTLWLAFIRSDGRLVGNVKASDLTGTYHGKPVRILSLQHHAVARRVLILVDTSGSMEPVRKFAWSVAQEVIAQLPQGTQMALLAFAEQTDGTPVFVADRDKLRSELSDLQTRKDEKMTALLDSMQKAAEAFGSPQEGDTIYVISDGQDNTSRLRWQKLQEQLVEHGIRVFAMLVRWRGPATPEESNQHLSDLVNSTGGYGLILGLDRMAYEERYYDKPLSDPSGKLTGPGRQLSFQVQAITYESQIVIQLPEFEGKKHDWKLRFGNPKLWKNVAIIYQRTLPPCSLPAATTQVSK